MARGNLGADMVFIGKKKRKQHMRQPMVGDDAVARQVGRLNCVVPCHLNPTQAALSDAICGGTEGGEWAAGTGR